MSFVLDTTIRVGDLGIIITLLSLVILYLGRWVNISRGKEDDKDRFTDSTFGILFLFLFLLIPYLFASILINSFNYSIKMSSVHSWIVFAQGTIIICIFLTDFAKEEFFKKYFWIKIFIGISLSSLFIWFSIYLFNKKEIIWFTASLIPEFVLLTYFATNFFERKEDNKKVKIKLISNKKEFEGKIEKVTNNFFYLNNDKRTIAINKNQIETIAFEKEVK